VQYKSAIETNQKCIDGSEDNVVNRDGILDCKTGVKEYSPNCCPEIPGTYVDHCSGCVLRNDGLMNCTCFENKKYSVFTNGCAGIDVGDDKLVCVDTYQPIFSQVILLIICTIFGAFILIAIVIIVIRYEWILKRLRNN